MVEIKQDSADRIRPLVKWVGGKSWLVDELIARMPAGHGRYYEPFAGGAALFLALDSRTSGAVLGDANPDLISMYQCVAGNVDEMIDMLHVHERKHCRSWYEAQRELFNWRRHKTEAQRAATFVYLTRTAWNGLWRVNGAGEFNVPMGRYKSPLICPELDLRMAAPLLFRTKLSCGDYRATVSDAESGDVVYMDPPYDTIDDGFVGFTAGGFGRSAQRELAEFSARLRDRGVFVMISNSDTPRVRKFYRGWKIDRVFRSGAINSKASDRGKVAELIITP